MATRHASVKDLESGETVSRKPVGGARLKISHVFTGVEDAVYIALGILLTAGAAVALFNGAQAFVASLRGGAPMEELVNVLDRIKVVLEAAGTSLDNVLTATVYLVNRDDNLTGYSCRAK